MSKKQQQPQRPPVAIREIANKAYTLAWQLVSSRADYDRELTKVHRTLERASKELDDTLRYATSIGHSAGNVVQFLSHLQDNMRLDLIVKAAAEIQACELAIEQLMPLLTDDERAICSGYLSQTFG